MNCPDLNCGQGISIRFAQCQLTRHCLLILRGLSSSGRAGIPLRQWLDNPKTLWLTWPMLLNSKLPRIRLQDHRIWAAFILRYNCNLHYHVGSWQSRIMIWILVWINLAVLEDQNYWLLTVSDPWFVGSLFIGLACHPTPTPKGQSDPEGEGRSRRPYCRESHWWSFFKLLEGDSTVLVAIYNGRHEPGDYIR